MKRKTKRQLAADLNKFLLIKGIAWQKLRKADLIKLHEAFKRLKFDVDQVFTLLEESQPQLQPVSGEKPFYVI